MSEYIGAPYQSHSTSKEAAKSILPKVGTQRHAVMEFIRTQGIKGATDEEVQTALNLRVQSETPRRVELVRDGLVHDSGSTRQTSSDKPATVWVASSKLNELVG
jgi:hypothetical protein